MAEASQTLPSGEMTGLAYWVKDVLFDQFKKNRKPIEEKWERNRKDFRCVARTVWKKGEGEDWRSRVVSPSTKIKVLSAFAMVADMLLQGGEIPFDLKPSPWDRTSYDTLPEEEQQAIDEAIEDAKGLIKQQFADCHADRQLMRSILAKAIYGESWTKGFVHEVTRSGFEQVSMAPEGLEDPEGQYTRWEPYEEKKLAPAIGYRSCWSIFWDTEEDDIQKGAGVIERDMVSPYWLRQQKGKPFWIDEAIEKAIKEAQRGGEDDTDEKDRESLPPILREVPHRRKTIQLLELWGRAPEKIVESFEKSKGKDEPTDESTVEFDGKEVEVLVVLAGDHVVRFARNDDHRPFYRDIWEDNLDEAAMTGVADNNEQMQEVQTGLIRAFLDNKKLSANVMGAIKKRFIPNWTGECKPGEWLEVSEEADDARQAFQQIIIQDVGESLLSAIGIFERYADEATQLPKIMQGAEHEKQKPDTLGEIQILQANAGKYLGSVIRNTDERWTEPIVADFHRYNMEDPDVQRGKGNFQAQALGFTSFQDKMVRLKKILQAWTLFAGDQEARAMHKVRDIVQEVYKALDVDPDQFIKTMDEIKEAAEQQMEAAAQQEARVREIQLQMRMDEVEAEQAGKAAEHERKLEENRLDHQQELEVKDKEFEDKVAMKALDQAGKKIESQGGSE